MSYGDMERDMYSMAQQAVAKGYGNREYFLAQPTALSNRVKTTVSARSLSGPDLVSALGLLDAMSRSNPSNYLRNVTTFASYTQI
jgi:hypothetical protein